MSLRAHLAVELEPEKRIDDRPGVDDGLERIPRLGGRQGELLPALQEKGTFLGIKKGVAEVEIDLPGVGFDLAEVGIDRPVQDELGGQAVFAPSG